MVRRRRLDAELVEQGLFSSKDEAMRAVLAGDVSTSDRRMEFPGEQVRPGIELHVRGRIPYVGWGGLSVNCQTLAVLSDSGAKSAPHTAGRLLSAVFGSLFAWGFAQLGLLLRS